MPYDSSCAVCAWKIGAHTKFGCKITLFSTSQQNLPQKSAKGAFFGAFGTIDLGVISLKRSIHLEDGIDHHVHIAHIRFAIAVHVGTIGLLLRQYID